MDNEKINLSQLDELDNNLVTTTEVTSTRRSVLSKYATEPEEGNSKKRIKKVKPVCFSISFELDEKIDSYCERKYMKKSTFAVLALEEFLNKKLAEET